MIIRTNKSIDAIKYIILFHFIKWKHWNELARERLLRHSVDTIFAEFARVVITFESSLSKVSLKFRPKTIEFYRRPVIIEYTINTARIQFYICTRRCGLPNERSECKNVILKRHIGPNARFNVLKGGSWALIHANFDSPTLRRSRFRPLGRLQIPRVVCEVLDRGLGLCARGFSISVPFLYLDAVKKLIVAPNIHRGFI